MAIGSLRPTWLGIIAVGLPAVSLSPAGAEDHNADKAALLAALKDAPVTLEQGMKASERTGKPIAAKFEFDDGKLRLSVYTAESGGFTEVVVAPDTGAVVTAEKITAPEDLKAAESQAAVTLRRGGQFKTVNDPRS